MRTEFEILKKEFAKVNYGQPMAIAMDNLEKKIIEIEKRLECARRSNLESNSIVLKMTDRFEGGNVEDKMTYGDFETLARGVYDVDIALNFNDNEPIQENWYGLFEEPKKEEPKVLIPKGSVVEWRETIKYFSAIGGAKAIVLRDYTTEHESNDKTIQVEWVDNKANGQSNGGYYLDKFKEEFEQPTKIIDTTMGKNIVEDIITKLKQIDVDGETMQYIIEQVGMTDQMLRQLVMSNPESDTKDLLEEKKELNNKSVRGCIEI